MTTTCHEILPERLPYYDALLDGLPDGQLRVARIVRGVAWTAAVLENGQTGVAMHTLGESRPPLYETLEGLPVREAARAVLSWNFEEASAGMAAVNACYNTEARIEALGARYTDSALEGVELRGKRLAFVGHLIHHGGITEALAAQAKDYVILEREPKEGDYPDSACEYLLPKCDVAVITGSAWVNKTMPRLLELCRDAEVVLTGPTVPLCPALLELGVRRLNGCVITDPEAMLPAIQKERRSVNAFCRHFTLGR
ncbi:MAG: DUF364 domain-containing protein [Oscillospiraceae bacterium]|nr:DUF364 domain-containing protein [Oscillospiraceae bacterium]